MSYHRSQTLNKWSEMIGRIYDGTQNYSKTSYEIHCHLTEVTGAFGKMVFKKSNYEAAREFLPKMFVWAISLFRKVKGMDADLQHAILIKYPTVCSYCLEAPCICWSGHKPEVKFEIAKNKYLQSYASQDKSLNGLQLMFRTIYQDSWGLNPSIGSTEFQPLDYLRTIYTRMIEELAETAESIRFHHLYPSNFNNEMADYFAWWFALVTVFNRVYNDERELLLAENIVWPAYPNYCISCGLELCDCRPGPVRELLSSPSFKDLASIDGLTQAENQYAFNEMVGMISKDQIQVTFPIACIKLDVDELKQFNNELSHSAGDNVLKTVVTALRQKVKPRDKIYRVGGDEFAIICQEFSAAEAEGLMDRFAKYLKTKTINGNDRSGNKIEKEITLSIGITSCSCAADIENAFEFAEEASLRSKEMGRDRITKIEAAKRK